MSRQLLTAEEVGQALGVSAQTVRLWVRKGQVPEVRISLKVRRFYLPDVENALRQGTRTPTAVSA